MNFRCRLLTPGELSLWLGIPETTLAKWRACPGRNPIPFVKLSHKTVRYNEQDVLKWIERNTKDKPNAFLRAV